MRAIEPTESGRLRIAGFEISYEAFGSSDAPPVLLLPTWQIVHSRIWKMQVPFLSRYFRVITYDPPGNGGGERTTDPRAFEYDRIVDQAIGLLDHLSIDAASVVGISRGCNYAISMAARFPDRVTRLLLISNGMRPEAWRPVIRPEFREKRESYDGWEKRNAHYWREHYDDWLDFFFNQLFPEPHSTKGIEDAIGWGRETTPEILTQTVPNPDLYPRLNPREAIDRVRCPVLIVHGDNDRYDPIDASLAMVEARPDWHLVVLEGCGHVPLVRDPVRVNQIMAEFLGAPKPTRQSWRRAMTRTERRVLFVSSPIGLGHIQRDLAIARELRKLVPDVQIDWLAQSPVTHVLERAGETIHPMSKHLASESAHWESEAGEHQLHCFHAFRKMDEILLANFMVFLDVVRDQPYDLWIGDEAWDVDYYLHENPELKTSPYVFMTDFLGWLPVDRSQDSREAFLTADYNAEMVEQINRFSRVRDRALYFGEYDDLIPERFGPDLPLIPDWAREHFEGIGYVAPFDPDAYRDTSAVRERLGYQPDEQLVIAAVGGTSTGHHLLKRIADMWPMMHRERPSVRCIVVAGPRIDPTLVPHHDALEVRPYIHNLYEHLAVADLGIVQGGLGTTMELTVSRRPFLYFPLKDHFEQQFHVAHRLDRYRAGVRMDYHRASNEDIAEAALATIGADTSGYRPHEPDAAARAASRIAELL